MSMEDDLRNHQERSDLFREEGEEDNIKRLEHSLAAAEQQLTAANARIKELESEMQSVKECWSVDSDNIVDLELRVAAAESRATAAEASVVALVDLLKKEADRHAVEARVAAKAGRRLQGNHQHEIAGILLRLHEAALTATAAQSAAILRAEAVKLLGEAVAIAASGGSPKYVRLDLNLPLGTPLYVMPKE